MRVTVLMGGSTDERDVSLASGCQVADALRRAGHDVVAVDTARGALSRSEEASLLQSGVGVEPPGELGTVSDSTQIARHEEVAAAEMVFPALHGGQGEDGTIQALLELAGVPYVGSGVLGCGLAMDKDVTKRLLRDAGVPTPDWLVGALTPERVLEVIPLPVIVKPVSGGSSVNLALACTADELVAALATDSGEPMMAEAYVGGREFTVGIVGDETLPVGEIIPAHDLFDYECKYQAGLAQEIFPAEIPDALARTLRETALEVHRLLRLRDFSRVDFIVDDGGGLWCLEANALPGLTANSLLPKAARAAGIEFPTLCDRIVQLASGRLTGSRA